MEAHGAGCNAAMAAYSTVLQPLQLVAALTSMRLAAIVGVSSAEVRHDGTLKWQRGMHGRRRSDPVQHVRIP